MEPSGVTILLRRRYAIFCLPKDLQDVMSLGGAGRAAQEGAHHPHGSRAGYLRDDGRDGGRRMLENDAALAFARDASALRKRAREQAARWWCRARSARDWAMCSAMRRKKRSGDQGLGCDGISRFCKTCKILQKLQKLAKPQIRGIHFDMPMLREYHLEQNSADRVKNHMTMRKLSYDNIDCHRIILYSAIQGDFGQFLITKRRMFPSTRFESSVNGMLGFQSRVE